ncbi:MAG: radical SAM protein [Candidatus Omnitrophota bacterium]
MRIVVCNVPLRSENLKTTYPPLGALAVIQSLRAAGYDTAFYDINVFRYTEDEMKSYFAKNKFDIVGISATVSTSYKFVKKLASAIRNVSPNTVIVAGGALTASAEILVKFSDVDFCVICEGEKTIVNLADHISRHGRGKDSEELKKIKGICFLDSKSAAVFTGYEQQISVSEITDADYGIIEKHSRIDNYIIEPFYYEQFKHDSRSYEERREGKKLATVVSSRGCVNRCTFCHRWQRGIRILPVDRVIGHIRHLQKNHNVGFVSFGDEDFGANRKWTEEFIEKIKPLDILYRISGARADNVNLDLLNSLRQSGCVSIHYGFESGSDDMLKVMEKRADAALNVRVAEWTHKAGLQTVYALVVGMPGESHKTIKETTGFCEKVTEFLPRDPILSVNALVALPGAPVYEYARYKGFLGKTLEDEENYLLRISDQGGESIKQLNLTDYPYFIVQGWIRCIYWAVNYNYHVKKNLPRLSTKKLISAIFGIILRRNRGAKGFSDSLFSNTLFYRLRYVVAPLVIMLKNYKEDKSLFFQRCLELAVWPFKKKEFTDYVSVRAFLAKKLGDVKQLAPNSVEVLKWGR